MKKHILFIFMLLAFSMIATAQNKKIAILETIDKKGNVPYGISLQLRSNLTYAISNTEGYEGYDRVDMASIMGEHNFQRTGVVSDVQIRKLGEMTGCSSILVAEAAVYDADHIIITAKILDVETASVKRSVPPVISSTKAEKMQEACVKVANQLLAIEEPIEEVELRKGLLTKGRDFYYLDGQRLTNDDYMELIRNCPEAWMSYERGCRRNKTGRILLISGGACGVLGGIVFGLGDFVFRAEDLGNVGLGMIVLCPIVLSSSIPFFISGSSKKNNAYKVYNEYCAKPTATLSFGPSTNGIGLGIYLNF